MTLQEIIDYHSKQSGMWALTALSSAEKFGKDNVITRRQEAAARFHRSACDHLQETHPDTVRLQTLVTVGAGKLTEAQEQRLDAIATDDDPQTLDDFRKWLDVAGEALK